MKVRIIHTPTAEIIGVFEFHPTIWYRGDLRDALIDLNEKVGHRKLFEEYLVEPVRKARCKRIK